MSKLPPVFNPWIKVKNRKPRLVPIIIKDNAEGIIRVRQDGAYFVFCDDKIYNINPDCYKCKGKKEVYLKKLDEHGHRIKIIRDIDHRIEMDNRFYLPFAPGLVCKGKVIQIRNEIVFHISKVYNLSCVQDVRDATKEWLEYLINLRELKENG